MIEMNMPEKAENPEKDLYNEYKKGYDLKALSKRYCLKVSEVKKIIKKFE